MMLEMRVYQIQVFLDLQKDRVERAEEDSIGVVVGVEVPCHFVEVGVVVPDSAWHCARRG
jgi:hypothetical protein